MRDDGLCDAEYIFVHSAGENNFQVRRFGRNSRYFKRLETGGNGVNVYCEVPISFVQATLGATVKAPTLDGLIELKIPEGTQSGTVFKIRGKGIQQLRGEGRGDEFVKVKVLTPKNLSAYQRKLLQDFEKNGNDATNNPEQKSFFDKLKDLFK